MTVRSEEVRKTKRSAIITREQLDRQRGAFERFTALALLLLSFAGSAAAMSGGWSALRAEPRAAPIAIGIIIQAALTATEYWYGAGRGPWRYRVALVFDSALTTVGYGPLFVPFLTTYLAGRGTGELSAILAWGIVGIVAVGLAWWPEKVLID